MEEAAGQGSRRIKFKSPPTKPGRGVDDQNPNLGGRGL